MNYESFHQIDPGLAKQFLEAEKFRHELSEWLQSLRDQIYRRLEDLGKGGLGEPGYQDEISTVYASIDDQAAAIDDPVLNPLVAELESYHSSYDRNAERRGKILDEIRDKHGLNVATIVSDDLSLEDQFDFIPQA